MTNWLAFYNERRQFRSMMRDISLADRDRLAFLDVTRAMQHEEGIDHAQARLKLMDIIDRHKQQLCKRE